MGFLLLSFIVLIATAAALTVAQRAHSGPGKILTGRPGLPRVDPMSSKAGNITTSETR
jgi:hypothetical protein